MAQEEHAQKYSNSSSGGGGGGSGSGGGCGGGSGCRSSKKMKQKKVPQRGLGVAQLEKIRIEEQQKKDAALQAVSVLSPNPIISPSNSSSCLAVQCPTFRPSVSSSSSVPLLPSSPSNLPSPNSIFKPAQSIPSVDILHPNSAPLSKPLNVSGADMGWPAVSGPGHANWPKVWSGEYNLEGENQRLDHHGFTYRSNVNLAYEPSAPLLPLPNFMQRSQQFQQPSSSSTVSISTGISSSPLLNFQMEPPSNQIFYAGNYTPSWPDEEKIIGMKRPYPFSTETPPAPSFHFKFPPCYVAPASRTDESASCSNRCSVITDPGIPIVRDGPAISSTVPEPTHLEVKTRENGGLNGDFLTLAPPATAHLSSKYQQSLTNSGPQSRELSEFKSQPSQGSSEATTQVLGSSKSTGPTFFRFLPSAQEQIREAAAPANNCIGEAGESLDLSLKL